MCDAWCNVEMFNRLFTVTCSLLCLRPLTFLRIGVHWKHPRKHPPPNLDKLEFD